MPYGTVPVKVNSDLARRVARLHAHGYIYDFAVINNRQLLCLQTNTVCGIETTEVKLVDHGYDSLYAHYKYVHSVESENGDRGIILLNFILFDAIKSCPL